MSIYFSLSRIMQRQELNAALSSIRLPKINLSHFSCRQFVGADPRCHRNQTFKWARRIVARPSASGRYKRQKLRRTIANQASNFLPQKLWVCFEYVLLQHPVRIEE